MTIEIDEVHTPAGLAIIFGEILAAFFNRPFEPRHHESGEIVTPTQVGVSWRL